MTRFPGIDTVEHEMVFRTMGGAGSTTRIGAGFMHKPGGWENRDSHFPTYALVYVLRGAGTYVDHKGLTHRLSSGSFFQRIPSLLHSNSVEAGSNYLECYVDLPKELAEIMLKMRVITEEPICGNIGLNQHFVQQVWELKERLNSCSDDEFPQACLDCIAFAKDFLQTARVTEEGDDDSQIIEIACQFLSSDLSSRLNLRAFCQQHGWGYERFRKLFTGRMGISPKQYRIRRRLDVACQLLNDPRNSVTEIAHQLGYPSPFEFSAQFKKHFGSPPTLFRS